MDKELRDIIEKVYTDGLINGTKSVAETNYKNSGEAITQIKALFKSKLPTEREGTYCGEDTIPYVKLQAELDKVSEENGQLKQRASVEEIEPILWEYFHKGKMTVYDLSTKLSKHILGENK